MSKQTLKPHQSALLGALILSLVVSVIPWVQALFRPLVYLNTHIHELCHAVVSVATGGQVQEILVNADGSGSTPVLGGNILLIAAAGYVGSTLIGACIIRFGSSPGRARVTMAILAGLLAVSMLAFVRGGFIGIVSGFAWIFLLGLGAFALRGNTALFACQFIGLEQCLTSLTSVYQLLRISVIGEAQSDAQIMQAHTLIPAVVWATSWCFFSLATIFVTVRWVWKGGSRPGPQPL